MIGKKKQPASLDQSRQALIWLHPQALFAFMTSKRWVVNDGHLPPDVQLHHVYYDPQRQVFAVVLLSKEFKSLKMGEPLPELPPISFRYWNPGDGELQ